MCVFVCLTYTCGLSAVLNSTDYCHLVRETLSRFAEFHLCNLLTALSLNPSIS